MTFFPVFPDVRNDHRLGLLADPYNFSAWGESSLMESLTHLSGGRSKYVRFFAYTIGDRLTRNLSKLIHTLLTDAEAVFLGFSNACVSAGRVDCKLLTLLHKHATGEEVKRFIEDSHDVGNSPVSVRIFLTLDVIRS